MTIPGRNQSTWIALLCTAKTDLLNIFYGTLCKNKNQIHHRTMFQFQFLFLKSEAQQKVLIPSRSSSSCFQDKPAQSCQKTTEKALREKNPLQRVSQCFHKNFSGLTVQLLPGTYLDLTSLLRPIKEYLGCPAFQNAAGFLQTLQQATSCEERLTVTEQFVILLTVFCEERKWCKHHYSTQYPQNCFIKL